MRRNLVGVVVVAMAVGLGAVNSASACPILQLDIGRGVYDTGSQTVVSVGPAFDLFALKLGARPATTYYLSAALVPGPALSGSDVGSFSVGEMVVEATKDMLFGAPPAEGNLGFDGGDLSKHDIFETYFYQVAIPTTADWYQVGTYNVQDNPGGPRAGTGMWAMKFAVDVGGLDPGYAVHFDLYSEKAITRQGVTDLDAGTFAPFSHDAESGQVPVPEPATLLLVGGAGLLGAARAWRKRRR